MGSCLASPTLLDIMQRLRIVSFLLVLLSTAAQQYVAFDAASASSTYSVGNLAGSPAFGAQQALSGGSGYWQIVFDMCDRRFLLFLNWIFCEVLKWQPCSGPEQRAEITIQIAIALVFARFAPWHICCSCSSVAFPLRCDVDRQLEFAARRLGRESELGICIGRGESLSLERRRKF